MHQLTSRPIQSDLTFPALALSCLSFLGGCVARSPEPATGVEAVPNSSLVTPGSLGPTLSIWQLGQINNYSDWVGSQVVLPDGYKTSTRATVWASLNRQDIRREDTTGALYYVFRYSLQHYGGEYRATLLTSDPSPRLPLTGILSNTTANTYFIDARQR